jgi:hypothetical protein
MNAIFDRIADAYAAFNRRDIDGGWQPCTPTSNGRTAWKGALYAGTMPSEATGGGGGS